MKMSCHADRRSALAGTFAVALMLGGTRWASYLGASPFFLTDILMLAAACHYIIGRAIAAPRWQAPNRPLAPARPPVLAAAIAGYAFLRFVAGGQVDVLAARDAAPYFYAGIAVLSASHIARSTPRERDCSRRLLTAALAFHAAWYFLVTVVLPDLPLLLPTLSGDVGVHVFTTRNDIDAALTGVYAALLLKRVLAPVSSSRIRQLMGFSLCWSAVLLNQSRAGLLGATVVNVLAFVLAMRVQDHATEPKKLAILLAPLLLATGLVLLPSTPIGDRLGATFSRGDTQASASAVGTTRARISSWGALYDWVIADTGRTLVGVGYGPNFMVESGASLLLVGTEEEGARLPRSPHNYWLGTLARNGVLGFALLAGFCLAFLRAVWRRRATLARDELAIVVAAVPTALFIPATLGVVLESPFGAIPFFWCAGALLWWPGPSPGTPSTAILATGVISGRERPLAAWRSTDTAGLRSRG